jgi:GT2 family glycosyltransferase
LKTLSIILLTHNRPLQAYEAIISIATQNNKNFKLIISDNSSDSSLKDMLNRHIFNSDQMNFDYRKRDKVYSAVEHGNLCLDEVDTDYFCLFHDDDLMLPNFVENFWAILRLNPQIVSCGMNAYIDNLNSQEEKRKTLFFKDFRLYIGPISPKSLIEKYFGRHQLGIAPYPSYIYKKSALEKIRFMSEDGKYGDVTWLLRVSAMGPMIWVNLPSMIYRLHHSNDSLTELRRDRLRFLSHIKKNTFTYGEKILEDYRFFIYKKLVSSELLEEAGHKRFLLFKKYMAFYRIKRLFRIDQHFQFLKKIIIKLLMKINGDFQK